jgi:serine/threonine protein kinase
MEKKAKKWIEDVVQQKIIKSIPRSEFKTDSIKKIGEGSFGSVVKAYWINSHRYVACKQLTTLFNTQCKTWEKFKHELHMQIRAHECENVIRILGISKSKFKFNFYTIISYG